ncbi:hypothetical protein VTH06DRAFT_509 [Thermothelomyces fergusii]
MAEPRAAAHVTNGFRPAADTYLGPRSLADMCLRVAISNVRHIQSLGNLPPQFTGPILRHVRTAEQLHQLELNSDDIYDQTAAHWMRIIKDRFPELASQHNFVPQNRKSWHKVYDKYEKLHEEQIAAATEKLKHSLAAQTQQQLARKSTIISSKESVGLPRPKAKPGYSFVPKKRDFFSKTRTQLRMEAGRFKTSPLTARASQIKKAPAALIEHARIQSQPSLVPPPPPLRLRAPSRPAAVSSGGIASREEKEARLLRIKNADKTQPQAGGNVVAFSDDEDDDLFGDLADPEFQDPAGVGDEQPGKHRRSVWEADVEQPTKRRRGDEEESTAPISSASNKSSTLSSTAPQQSVKRRPKGLSAAPGANKGVACKPASQTVTGPAMETAPKPASKVNLSPSPRLQRSIPMMDTPSASRSRSPSPTRVQSTAGHGRRAALCGSQDRAEPSGGLQARSMQPADRYPILRPNRRPKNG